MSIDINEKTLSYVETTGKALGVALKMAEVHDANEKAATDKIGGVSSKLRAVGLVDSDDTEKAASQLGDHAQTLDILANVVDHYEGKLKESMSKEASASLGSGSEDSETSTGTGHTKNANYVGRRRGWDDGPSESDRALLRLIGN
jgi:hypothetical protein